MSFILPICYVSIIKHDTSDLTSPALTLAKGICLVVQVHSHALFCRFENVDVSWRSSDTSPQKKYIAVIVLFDPVPLYSVWLLIVSFQLATYLQHQKYVFPFADEIF